VLHHTESLRDADKALRSIAHSSDLGARIERCVAVLHHLQRTVGNRHVPERCTNQLLISLPRIVSDVIQSKQIATSESVEEGILQATLSCRHPLIFLVSQPGTTADEIQDAKGLPKLKKRSESGQSWFAEIPQVLGTVDIKRLAHEIVSTCDAQDLQECYARPATPLNGQSAVVRINLPGKNMRAEGRISQSMRSIENIDH